VMEFLREHSTFLLAVFTVLIAFAGTWLGAKVQASGGIAQARAAKEAAETAAAATLQAVQEQANRAAEAAHATALRDQQTAAISNLLRTVREYTKAIDRLYAEPNTAAVEAARNDFIHAQGAVELVAPNGFSDRLMSTAESLAALAHARAVAERANQHMRGTLGVRARERARQAESSLAFYRRVALRRSFDSPETGSTNGEMVHANEIAGLALSRVPGLTREQQRVLLRDCLLPELGPELDRCRREHNAAMSGFIAQARILLGVTP